MSRVVVVGAGVIGMAVAYALRRRAHDVTLVDRALPGTGCSRGNAGWICPSLSTPLASPELGLTSLVASLRRDSPLHVDPRALPALAPWLWQFWRRCNARDFARGAAALERLSARTMQAFDEWAADGVSFEMYRAGILWAFLDPGAAREAAGAVAATAAHGAGGPAILDGDALRALEPDLAPAVRGGFVVDADRHVRPESLVKGLERRLVEMGATFRAHVEIDGASARGRSIDALQSPQGDLSADRFVIAAGAWSGVLAQRLGASLALQAGKGYSITLADSALSFRRAVYLPEVKTALSPFRGQLRVAGTMELSGVNAELHRRRVDALQRSAERFLRLPPRWEQGERWVGARPLTADGLPHIGRLPPFDNVFVATGHGMLGVTLAPATGELLAQLMDGDVRDGTHLPFDPAR